jgi:hypothetical protein
MNPDALHYLKSLAKENSIVEVDLQMMEQAVRDKGFDRPYFPFLLMMAEKQSHMIVGIELLTPIPSLEAMWEELPAVVSELLANYGLPEEVQVKDPIIALLLAPLEKELGIKVNLVSRLPTLEHAQKELGTYARGLFP